MKTTLEMILRAGRLALAPRVLMTHYSRQTMPWEGGSGHGPGLRVLQDSAELPCSRQRGHWVFLFLECAEQALPQAFARAVCSA